MTRRTKLQQAIALILGTSAISASTVAFAEEGDTLKLEEVIVTATKRAENMQNVPVTVQALTQQALENQNVTSFSDYVKQLPNVSFAGRGPGQNDVYIRGMATGRGSLFQSGGVGAGPTVAFYIDEAPLTASGRNIDVYVTDIDRVEVLPGPQGTLFGASSQAGTIRLITNKPDASKFSARAEVKGATTQGGDMSWGVEGFLNLPLIENKLALRIAGYDVRNGGYIDNVHGTTSWAVNPNIGPGPGQRHLAPGGQLLVADNAAMVRDNINDDRYTGVRAAAKLDITDNWDLTVGFMSQELSADGVFDYSPSVGDLKVQRFEPDTLVDRFNQYNMKAEGRMGWLDVVYAGSYLEHKLQQEIGLVSGTATAAGYQVYYNCVYNSLGEITLCSQPHQRFHGVQDSSDIQHELRFSTDASKPLRFIGGVWYAKSIGGVSQEWAYHSPEIKPFAPNAPYSIATHFDPRTRDPSVAFFNDLKPLSRELSFFGELTYDILDRLSVTLGARRYNIKITPRGSYNWVTAGTVDADDGGYLDRYPPAHEKSTIKKLTLSYKPAQQVLLYATYSEGFRRGGFNRGGDVYNVITGQLAFPAAYDSDTVKNYEVGLKSTGLDGRLRFNGSAYYVDWDKMQIDVYDPATFGNLLFTANLGKSKVKGLEGDIQFLATDALSIGAAFSFNQTELTDRPAGAVNLKPVGSSLPLTPAFQGNINFRYAFPLAGNDAFAQLSLQHRGSTFTTLDVNNAYALDGYTTADASFGVKVHDWDMRIFLSNLTNKRTELFKSTQEGGSPRTVTSRPRTLELKVARDF